MWRQCTESIRLLPTAILFSTGLQLDIDINVPSPLWGEGRVRGCMISEINAFLSVFPFDGSCYFLGSLFASYRLLHS